uniref:Protein kinase domain-containing protein n=1 Tax=Glossina austeni TaxID=7395 RepID=A0A1A9VPT8_GLOAU
MRYNEETDRPSTSPSPIINIIHYEVMKSLEPHVNVVRFLGCCTDKDPIFVIIEYVNRGKLQTYLRNSRAESHIFDILDAPAMLVRTAGYSSLVLTDLPLDWCFVHYGNTHGKSNILTSGDLTSFMYQVAKGMDYLTSRGAIAGKKYVQANACND